MRNRATIGAVLSPLEPSPSAPSPSAPSPPSPSPLSAAGATQRSAQAAPMPLVPVFLVLLGHVHSVSATVTHVLSESDF